MRIEVIAAACLAIGLQCTAARADDDKELCTQLSELASTVMGIRQAGGALSETVNRLEAEDTKVGKLIEIMIVEAWEEPYWHTADRKERATTEYADKWMMMCLKARSEK